ncbi:uncharacterized protein H6S33_007569 [Morchella sextelata]|uniref:uncharacterized protein n=1 Tax=Morchella sextelata TaxID=1174677 RepID=UPI001D04A017|nr:uncharacterized protein H6S33_007569 [Morchella sextelata]KAH0603910.1 hypothetical protein H6S33_007569 [Morchella sextelata]
MLPDDLLDGDPTKRVITYLAVKQNYSEKNRMDIIKTRSIARHFHRTKAQYIYIWLFSTFYNTPPVVHDSDLSVDSLTPYEKRPLRL